MAGAPRRTRRQTPPDAITADLVAVLVAVTDGEPKIMTIANAGALPSGPFELRTARCKRVCGRGSKRRPAIRSAMSSSSTPLPIADGPATPSRRTRISISYLGLAARGSGRSGLRGPLVRLVRLFPVEDHRRGPPAVLAKTADAAAARMGEIRIPPPSAARTLAARRHHVWF